MVLNSAVASLFCGGAPGAIQEVTWSFHLPASLASLWCSGPGVAALMYFSIIACSSAVGLCPEALGSWALAARDAAARTCAATGILDDIGEPPLWAAEDSLASSAFQERFHRDPFQELAIVLVQVDERQPQLSGPAPDHLALHQQRHLALGHLDREVDLRAGGDDLGDADGEAARPHGAGGQGRHLVRGEDVHLQLGRPP